jgi:Domain of unknown function (DUF3598)
MRSQWECVLQNLGEWHGSFTRFSPQGEYIEDIPSIASLEGINNNQTIHFVLRRFPPNQPVNELVLEFSSVARNTLFLETGAFSQGSIQLAPFTEFGAELALVDGNRRLRLVQQFDQNGQLNRLTLIRETLAGSNAVASPQVQIDDLIGEWQGQAVTLYPDLRPPDTYSTTLRLQKIGENKIQQQLSTPTFNISSTARIQDNNLYFDSGAQATQILLLPGGATSTSPQSIKAGQSFFLEVGWLTQSGTRQRLIRNYNGKGEWSSLTLVTEQKL